MKLGTKLICAFFTMILVPVVLSAAAVYGFGQYHMGIMEKSYGIEQSPYDLTNSTQIVSKLTNTIYNEVNKEMKKDLQTVLEQEYLEKINGRLKERSSYLAVRIGKSFVYVGKPDVSKKVLNGFPEFAGEKANPNNGIYIGGDDPSIIKQIDFISPKNEQVSIYFVTSVYGTVPELKNFVMDMLIAILVILILTSAVLTTWIYRGIVTPLHKLQRATQSIKEGSLDYVLEVDSKDEIGELCVDFEEMRLRLKGSTEEKLEYDKENKELISNISHDLKTPITAIKGYVEGIMDGVADTPEKMEKYIKTIYNKANEMDRLINELTLYSKIDTNRIPYTFSRLNAESYFGDCAEEIGLELESENIELAYFNYMDSDVQIIADAEQLARVIHNIISNSIKYMDKPKGFINMRIKDVGDFVQVEIEDNGKGIGQKELPYIFDRFYRTDTSRNSSKGGSGIGLSIVKKIIEDHGGKIWATSKENTGTVMYFVVRKYQEVPVSE